MNISLQNIIYYIFLVANDITLARSFINYLSILTLSSGKSPLIRNILIPQPQQYITNIGLICIIYSQCFPNLARI